MIKASTFQNTGRSAESAAATIVTVLWMVSIEIGKMLSLGYESSSELFLHDWGMQYMYHIIIKFKISQNEENGVKCTHFLGIMVIDKDKTTWSRAGATCLGTKLDLLCHIFVL